MAATTALEILIRRLWVADIQSADSPIRALDEFRQEVAVEAKALLGFARRIRHADPAAAAEALKVASELARIVSAIGDDVGHTGEPIGPRTVMNGRRATV